jgi:general secretion pathway protein D
MFAAGARADIQFQPPPSPAVLTAVAASDVSPGETRLVMTFSPKAPKYSIVKNDTDKPGIAFALSTRGDGARVLQALHGIVRQLSFEQHDTILVVVFNTAGPAHIAVAAAGDKELILTVTPPLGVHPQTAAQAAPVASGPLPGAVEIGPDDGFEVVPLKYADVSEVVGLLTDGATIKSNDTFQPHEPAFGSAGMNGGYVAPPPPNAEADGSPLAQSVDQAIGIDRRLNAVILRGSPQRIAQLKARIAQIDIPVQSVILETIFVELTESGARNVGLDFNNPNGQLAVATYQTGGFVPSSSYGSRYVSSLQLQAAIYEQVQKGRGRIVSKPRISAQSGSTAKIITGDALPILTAITLSGVNGVSQQVQYVNVGVTLQIAPRVSSDGFVTSHVFCVVSSVTGYSQGYPTISQREAATSATVHDGETFVIGGLTQENDISTKSAVPVLGEIPLLGSLFQLEKSTGNKTELYIVVTPHVVRRSDAPPALPPEAQ